MLLQINNAEAMRWYMELTNKERREIIKLYGSAVKDYINGDQIYQAYLSEHGLTLTNDNNV